MKIRLLLMAYFIILPISGYSQQWQGLFSVDTHTGYSTNTILNPFYGEWDRSEQSGYGYISPMGQIQWSNQNHTSDITIGGVYEPFFSNRETLKGGFGLLNLRRTIGSSWSIGFESGTSYLTSTANRSMKWIQPLIAYNPTAYSQLRFKAGSNYLDYRNELLKVNNSYRYDLYNIELETWPTFKSQLRLGIYGNLDNPTHNPGFLFNASHRLLNSVQLTLRLNTDRYSYQIIQEGGLGNPAGPPMGGPGGNTGTETEILNEADRLLRAGITGRYQVNNTLSISLNLDHISLHSSLSDEILSDYQFSVGLRYVFRTSFGGRGKATPRWEQNGNQSFGLRINYSGNGQLYIIGDFNDWEYPGIPLTRQSANNYAAKLSLPAGAYEYKILLIEGSEERWIDFSEETYTVKDGFGGNNGVVFIQ